MRDFGSYYTQNPHCEKEIKSRMSKQEGEKQGRKRNTARAYEGWGNRTGRAGREGRGHGVDRATRLADSPGR